MAVCLQPLDIEALVLLLSSVVAAAVAVVTVFFGSRFLNERMEFEKVP